MRQHRMTEGTRGWQRRLGRGPLHHPVPSRTGEDFPTRMILCNGWGMTRVHALSTCDFMTLDSTELFASRTVVQPVHVSTYHEPDRCR